MQERQVTLADTTFPLDDPFWVLATQNPVEQEGVYTLPEAQLDRFSMMLRVGYPSGGATRSRCCRSRATDQTRSSGACRRPTSTRLRDVHPRRGLRRRQDPRLHRPPRPRDARSRGASAAPTSRSCCMLGISPRSYQHMLALARVTAFLHGRTLRAARRREGDLPATRRATASRGRVRAQAENIDADAILGELLRGGADPMIPEHVMRELRYIEVYDRHGRSATSGSGPTTSPLRGAGLRLRRAPALPAGRRRAAHRLERHRAAWTRRSCGTRTPSAS